MNSHNESRYRQWGFARLVARLVAGYRRASCPRVKLTPSEFGGTMTSASTSLGEASARTQATDLERRKTPRVRTAPPGLRVEPKWLPESPDTPCSAKALSRGVRLPAHLPVPPRPVCTEQAPLCALAARR